MNCPDCRRTLAVGDTNCQCGWSGFADTSLVSKRPCHFQSDGKCRFYHDETSKFSKPRGATVRVNDYWICNWHYEHGYDRVLRNGEEIPLHEQKTNSRVFKTKETV